MEWITVLAVLLSPVVAVLVGRWLQDRRERRNNRLWILGQLMGGRHERLTSDFVRALNTIELVFHDDVKVRSLWRQYFDMLNDEGLNNEVGFAQRERRFNELLTAMAHSLGYRRGINHLDVDRVYSPVGIASRQELNERLLRELLRVLEGTESLAMRKRRKPPKPETDL